MADYTSRMAQPARRADASADEAPADEPAAEVDAPSLDPAAIERAYLRERARRRAVDSRRNAARSSNARFWVVLAVLAFLTVFLSLTAWRQVHTLFGV
jgi:hypothetical protein